MAFESEPQNPVFKVLAEIQRYTDVCPNPEDSDFYTCRAMRKDGGRCRNPPCTQHERYHSPSLMSEFRNMTECPDTESFYNKLETFITYSHCKRWHRWPALASFERWKKERIAARSNTRQRYMPASRPAAPARPSTPPPTIQPTTTTVIQPLTAAALQQLPSTPTRFVPSTASATSDGGDSVDDSILETRSVTSNGSTFLSSLPNTPPRNGLISGMEIDDIAEEVIIQEDGADWTAANAARARANADNSPSPSSKSIADVDMDTVEEIVAPVDLSNRISASADKLTATIERLATFLEEKIIEKEVASERKEVEREDVIEEAAVNKETVISNETASVETIKETITKQETEEKDNLEEGHENVVVKYQIKRKAVPEANDVGKVQDLASTSDVPDTVVTEEDTSAKEKVIDGLGIISLHRNGSLRDHSPVFQVINSHPTVDKMKEGVVYILEHKDNPSLFKIGWSSKSAEERLKQPNNCYGINTKVIYETQRFAGAPHAEKLAQVILRHANIRVLSCEKCKGGHREWFSANGETVRRTVMQVEEFVQMPAYTLQDGEYKLSPEVYSRVVRQMCDFSIDKMGELMHGKIGVNEAAKSTIVLCETISLAPITPPEISRPSTTGGFFEMHEANESFASLSSQTSGSKARLSAGTKVARKLKHFVAAKNTVKEYLTRSRGTTPEVEGNEKRALGSVFVDLKDKARGIGTKARQDVREFRRDFKEELRRKNDDEAE
ncbi:hypothetical protein M441DRAFT_60499 [Trichoderma asperellum CBS 433.97]|uniref:Bacteriophage T5 Orf172 DNA-binding domain-containing protein n=1 Tax=Trichoderma asperellum (strain ATCC 204424 / CBS 433.97 / NBRC 101777) TaxID=1042311 RepID=A0A2T3Z087_TRIA4|nr:hypothetical protein M441DRAFT_60499 [Trichoderma asperellum CBS 433.97]PTB38239.1 hypothetical protein M441DRAFT_60499 [Trichoderma asperellum CBS 433.97]